MGDAQFKAAKHHLGGIHTGFQAGDFDGDGFSDIYGVAGSSFDLFRGKQDGSFEFPTSFGFSGDAQFGTRFAEGDLDGDGRMDVVTASPKGVHAMTGANVPALQLNVSRIGSLKRESLLEYTIAVSNRPGASPTAGKVLVQHQSWLSTMIQSLSGEGWTCLVGLGRCEREDSLNPGNTYPPITMRVLVTRMDFLVTETSLSGGGAGKVIALEKEKIPPNSTQVISVRVVGNDSSLVPAQISQNTWLAIHGTRLVPEDTPPAGVTWSAAPEFALGRMPTQLGSIGVTVNGKPAYIYFYCSAATSAVCDSDQINVLTPLDNTLGTVELAISNHGQVVQRLNVSLQPHTNSLFVIDGGPFVMATHADYSLIGPEWLYPGSTTPAQRGETVVLWGTGFGLPATPLIPGMASQSGVLNPLPVCAIDGTPVQVLSANLAGPGLHQINVRIPSAMEGENHYIVCTRDGAPVSFRKLLLSGSK